MATKLTALTEKITASISDSDNYTVAVWFKIPTGVQADGQPVVSLNGSRQVMYGSTSGFNNDSGSGTGSKTVETWWYCAVVKNGTNTYHYIFEDVSTETVTGMGGDPRYGDYAISTLGVGDFKGGYGTAINNAEYVYMRAWNTNLSTTELNTEKNSATVVKTANLTYNLPMVSDLTALTGTNPTTAGSDYSFTSNLPTVLSSTPYSASPTTGILNYVGFLADQIGIHRFVQPTVALLNLEGFAAHAGAGRQFDIQTGYVNVSGFAAQPIYDLAGIYGRINFNTGTHQTHVTREFFGLLGQLRALGFLVDQSNSQGFFPTLGNIHLQGHTGATVTVVSPASTFTATALLRETHFVGLQAQTIRDFFPISAGTHAIGFTPQYVEFIKEITGPDQGEVNFSGFAAQAIILGQINEAIAQKGEVNLVGFQHAVDMWRTLDILNGGVNAQGFAAGLAIFQGGTVNISGVTGEVNFDSLQQAIGMYRTFYPDSGLTNAEGFMPTAAPGLSVQSIVGVLNHEGFVPFIVSERYRGIVGEMRLEGFAPTIGGGLWTPKRRRATSWAAIN